MKHLCNGFLFELGLLPLVIVSVWLFHDWPLFSPDIGAVEEFMFDKSQIQVGDVKLPEQMQECALLAALRIDQTGPAASSS